MSKGLSTLLVKFLSTKNRSMFTVQLGSALLLAKLGVVGAWAAIPRWILAGVLGMFIEEGVLLIDLALDSMREGAKLEEFKKIAGPLYEKASSGKKTEEEKQKIREEYEAIIRKIGPVGTGPR